LRIEFAASESLSLITQNYATGHPQDEHLAAVCTGTWGMASARWRYGLLNRARAGGRVQQLSRCDVTRVMSV
jgi:hypothetical protein